MTLGAAGGVGVGTGGACGCGMGVGLGVGCGAAGGLGEAAVPQWAAAAAEGAPKALEPRRIGPPVRLQAAEQQKAFGRPV